MENSNTVAKIILQQIGGLNKVNAMIGLKNLGYTENSLQFGIKIRGSAANFVKITLNSLDLYDIEFGNIRGYNYKQKSEFNNIYCDDLKKLIEKETGLYLSL